MNHLNSHVFSLLFSLHSYHKFLDGTKTRSVHGSSSLDQLARPARNRPATTRTDQSDDRLQVATHRTRTLRFGWRVSSPKTRATRPTKSTTSGDIWRIPDKKWLIPAIFLLFQLRSTWNRPDPVRSCDISLRSSPDSTDPTKYRPDLTGSGKISAPAMKSETDRHKPENRWTRTGQPDH